LKGKLSNLNRYHFTAVLFIVFIFISLITTLYSNFVSDNKQAKDIYRSYLNKNFSISHKVKSSLQTGIKIINNLDTNLQYKEEYTDIYGFVQNAIGSRYVIDASGIDKGVVKLDNGYITSVVKKNDKLVKKGAKNLEDFSDFLSKKGTDYIFILAPYKIKENDKKLPISIEDYSNENANKLLKELDKRNIDYLDLRKVIKEQGLDHYSMFFATDHHWRPEAGLWATKEICKELNNNYGFSIDTKLLDKENYEVTCYKDLFLGSRGKRVGQYYAGVDDFTIIVPKFKTSFDTRILRRNGSKSHRKGSFKKTFIVKANLKKDYYNINTYAAYTGGDYPLQVIKNKKNHSGKKIVFLRDSFSCVVTPYFSLAACSELHVIDPRHYKKSIRDYINKVDPDIVISLHNCNFEPSYFKIK